MVTEANIYGGCWDNYTRGSDKEDNSEDKETLPTEKNIK